MATKPAYDLEPAATTEIDAALRPFIERFVMPEKRERAIALFLPIRKRARPRDLVDMIDRRAIIELDRSKRANDAVAQISADLEGVYLTGQPAAYKARFGHAAELATFAHGDEEIFVAADGGCGLLSFEVGHAWLVAGPKAPTEKNLSIRLR